jgi:hypothetical protein
LQLPPGAHAGQFGPPQSTSVSEPFWTLSSQLACAQVPFLQTPVWQSPPALQDFPVAHREQVGPPQSMSVS